MKIIVPTVLKRWIGRSKINEKYSHEFWFCSKCKKIIMSNDEYCVNCGQAIDWRVENDE